VEVPEQVRVLPAAVAAGPAVTEKLETVLAGYENVHCRLAGALPEEVKFRSRETREPGGATAEDRLRED
jgi:hypothetical protein